MKEPVVLTTCTETSLVLVMFKFSSDDDQFRARLFDAILSDRCPDFECSLGSPSGTGHSCTALWRPEHADAVRAWARSIGIHVTSDAPSDSTPGVPHFQGGPRNVSAGATRIQGGPRDVTADATRIQGRPRDVSVGAPRIQGGPSNVTADATRIQGEPHGREGVATHIKLPDIGDIAPGGVVAPCIADVERMLVDRRAKGTL
jgi:hypothetical protein